MTIKPATQSSVTKGALAQPAVVVAPAAPVKKEKVKPIKPGLAAHKEVLSKLEHVARTIEDPEVAALYATIIKSVKWRMKPWAKVSVVYEDG